MESNVGTITSIFAFFGFGTESFFAFSHLEAEAKHRIYGKLQ